MIIFYIKIKLLNIIIKRIFFQIIIILTSDGDLNLHLISMLFFTKKKKHGIKFIILNKVQKL